MIYCNLANFICASCNSFVEKNTIIAVFLLAPVFILILCSFLSKFILRLHPFFKTMINHISFDPVEFLDHSLKLYCFLFGLQEHFFN